MALRQELRPVRVQLKKTRVVFFWSGFHATRGGDLGQILPILGVFVFAAQRLFPLIHNIYYNSILMIFIFIFYHI